MYALFHVPLEPLCYWIEVGVFIEIFDFIFNFYPNFWKVQNNVIFYPMALGMMHFIEELNGCHVFCIVKTKPLFFKFDF